MQPRPEGNGPCRRDPGDRDAQRLPEPGRSSPPAARRARTDHDRSRHAHRARHRCAARPRQLRSLFMEAADIITRLGPLILMLMGNAIGGWVLTPWLRIKNRHPRDDAWGQAGYINKSNN